ncbi:hypothetical protein PBDP_2586 [Pseudomonas sp. St290]|nr:hypothetical protein PBDP_2586 [Pseudomonas sp. St290]
MHHKVHCGSEPAREDVGTANLYASRSIAFASKPAPTGSLGDLRFWVRYRPIVGASLLAIAVGR